MNFGPPYFLETLNWAKKKLFPVEISISHVKFQFEIVLEILKSSDRIMDNERQRYAENCDNQREK